MTQESTGEINLNLDDRLQHFLTGIDNYISCKNLSPTKFRTEFAVAETLSLETLEKLTQDECFNYAYMLYQYADHVASEKASCETIVRWCENSFNSLISNDMEDIAHVIAKHEIKVATILKTNDLARKINEWKLTAEGRLEPLKSREYNVRRKADVLIEKGKRK